MERPLWATTFPSCEKLQFHSSQYSIVLTKRFCRYQLSSRDCSLFSLSTSLSPPSAVFVSFHSQRVPCRSLYRQTVVTVLAIFSDPHNSNANVIYTRPGMQDYEARSLNFLWVRWYEVDPGSSGWTNFTLHSVCFPLMCEDDSFGFVDPDDVLHGCHIIPAFAKGQWKETKRDVSCCAKDSKDYVAYYVGW